MKYEDLLKQYKLPKAEELEIAFDFEMKDVKFLSREILKKADEKFEWICSTIQDVIHSDSSMESLYEADFLDEEQKELLFPIFKEFAAKRRKIHGVLLDNIEKNNIDLINESYSLFQKHKQALEALFKTLSGKWENHEKENQDSESRQYFG